MCSNAHVDHVGTRLSRGDIIKQPLIELNKFHSLPVSAVAFRVEVFSASSQEWIYIFSQACMSGMCFISTLSTSVGQKYQDLSFVKTCLLLMNSQT